MWDIVIVVCVLGLFTWGVIAFRKNQSKKSNVGSSGGRSTAFDPEGEEPKSHKPLK
jgi:hypothetical protein